MVKPRLSPRQDQSSPLHSSRPLGFGHVLSDQPAASCLEHCELVLCESLLEFREARVALGKDDRIAWCWTLGPPV
uniref:Uncharacterized protein n=1 Tax=Brassica oleracea TaxID=3712 RepID=A0A3P6B4C4_BRAOL|nr:unnamed protein product [Brassica oleracea]